MTNEQKLRQWITDLRDDADSYDKEDGKATKGYIWAGAIYQEALRILKETDVPLWTPTIVCLCGSTRFYAAFQEANYRETMAGNIVLSVGFYPHSSEQAHGETIGITPAQKEALDQLHLRKVAMADEVLILNVDQYIGPSTAGELAYARSLGKTVRFLEEPIL